MKFDPNKLQAQAMLGVNHLVYEIGRNVRELPVGMSQGDCDRLLAEYIAIYAKQLTKQSSEMLHALRFATECDPKKGTFAIDTE
jgi:hypothetical protein